MSEEAKTFEEQRVPEYQPPADDAISEPEPTEKGPETIAKRAAELREIAMSAREGPGAALRAEAARFEKKKKRRPRRKRNRSQPSRLELQRKLKKMKKKRKRRVQTPL